MSLKAKGLLSQILGLPENWDYTLTGLAQINAEGKDAIRAVIGRTVVGPAVVGKPDDGFSGDGKSNAIK